MSKLKSRTINGLVWSAVEQFASQGIAFVLGILIARQVMPSEYGLIAMLGIFMAVAQTFIDSGFSNALVQKYDRSSTDFSTVFYFNIGVSVLIFVVLFFSAPLIAKFYNKAILEVITKVVSLNLIILAFAVVPRAKLTVEVDFKSQTKASIVAVALSGVIGVILAYRGFGVWALVFQGLISNSISTLILWFYSKWFPKLQFSGESFRRLFIFGSKLLFSALLDTIYRNIYLLVIGKKYSDTKLGFYSRASQLSEFPSSNLSRIIGRVAFPVMCEVQHDDDHLRSILRKFIKLSVFITFPIMVCVAAVAKPFISIVLTDKWIGVVPLLQILCLANMFYPVHGLNLVVLQAKGRTDLFLRLEIVKKIIGITILVITIPMGVSIMCWGLLVVTLLCLPVNLYYTKRILGLGCITQIKYIMPSLFLSMTMGVGIYLLTLFEFGKWTVLLTGVFGGIVFYYFIAKLFKMEELYELHAIISNHLNFFKRK